VGRNLTLTFATDVDTTSQQLLQAEIAINRHVSVLVAATNPASSPWSSKPRAATAEPARGSRIRASHGANFLLFQPDAP